MGTNFYLLTKEKASRDRWFNAGEYELTDFPEFGYEVHLAKTSGGWVPLFHAYKYLRSVSDIRKIYRSGGFYIVDEYGRYYDWDAFEKRVVGFGDQWNSQSHIGYDNGKYSSEFFVDKDGFEFVRDGC